jgi:hypothetical protein
VISTSDHRTWMERAQTDPTLAAFVDAECARRGIAVSAWRVEAEHWRRTAEQLEAFLDRARSSGDRTRRLWRTRAVAHRRRNQFAAPLSEGDLR